MDETNPLHLIDITYLQQSLTDSTDFDIGLANWALDVVSEHARLVASRPTWTRETVPPGVATVVSLAARRLYTNPDRFTNESSADYSYRLDSSVTSADIFTPSEIGALLKFAPGRSTGKLRTVATRRGDSLQPSGYVPDGTRYGFPWYPDDNDGWIN